MSAPTEQRKLAAIMFTDMVGYSALAQRNEALALELLEEHRRLVRDILPKRSGREVKTTGDGFLIEFPSALAAVQCAVEIQQSLAARNKAQPPERQVRIRIGIHLGDVMHSEGDVHGDGVNIAARIEPLAEAGGICISNSVHDQIENKVEHALVRLSRPELKNIQANVQVYKLVLEGARPRASARPNRRPLAVTLGVVAVLAAAAWSWWFLHQHKSSARSNQPAGRIASLAVKPLDDFSGDTNQAYLSDGMTEALCSALGNISALRVPGRSSVMRYKNSPKSIQEMARDLGVEAIVEGSVQRAANRVLITVQLVEATTDRHLWATNYQRDLSDFFKVQTEVAQAIAAEIQVRLSPQDEARLARARPANPQALEAYLKGRLYWNRWTEDGGRRALDYFQQAITLDPNFALAHAGLADAYWQLADLTFPASEAMPQARKAAEQALALDDSLAEAHTARAVVRFLYDYDWRGAEQEFARAIALNPGYATAHHQYGWLLSMRARYDEALAQFQRAAELEPLSPVILVDGNVPYTLTHQYAKAIAQCQKALEIDPNFYLGHFVQEWIELTRGNATTAVPRFQKAAAIEPAPWTLAWLGYAQAASGHTAEAQKLLGELDQLATTKSRFVTPQCQAAIYLGLGDKPRALEWLEKAYEVRSPWLTWLKVEPLFNPLRSEPRYQALLKKVGLDK